jgi:hypothetical protein
VSPTTTNYEEGGAVSATLPQCDSAREDQKIPATLAEAHELLWQRKPAWDADPLVWVEFHRHSATVYAMASTVDVRHKREALTCAGMEIRKARDIEYRLNPVDEDDDA